MARVKKQDNLEVEALKIGYGVLLQRVNKELETDTSIKAVLLFQKENFESRLKELNQ